MQIVGKYSSSSQGGRSCAKGICRKVWTRTQIFSPYIRFFVAILRFVPIYVLFGIVRAKQVFWGGKKQCFLEVHYYKGYIAYYTQVNLQICNYVQKSICLENSKYGADASLYGHILPRRKGANFCHPASTRVNFSCCCPNNKSYKTSNMQRFKFILDKK